MKILVVYDSLYGNTEKIAHAIVAGLAPGDTVLKTVKETSEGDLQDLDLFILGSPTHGGRASQPTKAFLDNLKPNALKNVSSAAFDTGIPSAGQNAFLRFVLWFFGYAAPKIATSLKNKGAKTIGSETFFVTDKEGPLKEGETERAEKWATSLMQKLN